MLVALARSGNLQAFERLILHHQTDVYRLALRMLGDRLDAEDATQEAFLRAWRGLRGFRGDSGLGTWLHRIALNHCFRQLRLRGGLTDALSVEAQAGRSAQLDVERQVEIRSALRQVGQALRRLTPEQRAVFVLSHLEDQSHEHIAETLGISVSAVRSRLHRARVEVLAAMEDDAP